VAAVRLVTQPRSARPAPIPSRLTGEGGGENVSPSKPGDRKVGGLRHFWLTDVLHAQFKRALARFKAGELDYADEVEDVLRKVPEQRRQISELQDR
jgi:hypothetical protein